MKKSRGDSAAVMLNMVWAVAAVAINYAINLLITPYVTENIGVEAYGFVSLANTFTAYIDVISVALNVFASRYIAVCYHKGDIAGANQFYSSVILADVILSVAVLIPSLALIFFLDSLLSISVGLVADVKILFVFVLIKYLVTVLRTAFNVGTFIKNRLDLSERQRALSYILQAAALVALCLLLKPHVYYVGVAALLAACFLLATDFYYVKKLTPELRFKRGDYSAEKVRTLVSAGIWNAINNVGNILNSGLDLLISNIMLSALAMGQISIAKNLAALCYTLVLTISGSFKPLQLKAYAEQNTAGLVNNLKMAMKVTGAVCSLIIAGFLAVGQQFLRLWIPTVENLQLVYWLIVLVLLSDIVIGVVNPLYYVYALTQKVRVPCFITLLMGAANVISMYVLIRFFHMGEYAVVVTTLVVNFVHFFDAPLYAAHCLKVRWTTFYSEILRHMVSCGISVLLMGLVSRFLPFGEGWIGLLLKILVLSIVGGAAVLLVVFDRGERKDMLNKVRNKFA